MTGDLTLPNLTATGSIYPSASGITVPNVGSGVQPLINVVGNLDAGLVLNWDTVDMEIRTIGGVVGHKFNLWATGYYHCYGEIQIGFSLDTASDDVELQFGGTNTKTLKWDATDGIYLFDDTVATAGDYAAVGKLVSGADTDTSTTDVTIEFGGTNVKTLKWDASSSAFVFDDDIMVLSTEKIYFRDTAISISSATDGHLDIDADVSIDLNQDVNVTGDVIASGDVTGGYVSLAELGKTAGRQMTNMDFFTSTAIIADTLVYFKIGGTNGQGAGTSGDPYQLGESLVPVGSAKQAYVKMVGKWSPFTVPAGNIMGLQKKDVAMYHTVVQPTTATYTYADGFVDIDSDGIFCVDCKVHEVNGDELAQYGVIILGYIADPS